ncbi:MAG: hypothetical protein UR94_C0024G0028 [Parcubacteria group bacterium GW2011_GWA2_36_10]|nr:MAG: hypothetical protein UR94_C0024G0028 [Parcubacteria group bacterium GW2011_GWA2_36_10]
MHLNRKTRIKYLTIIVWVCFFTVTGFIYYVNHYLPKGPLFSTGDIICMNDGRGPCAPEYIEEVRDLNIPGWAKFFKKSEGELLWMALLFLGIILPAFKNKKAAE